jgi:parallel beta-helix repeat protein
MNSHRRCYRPRVVELEGRVLPSTFTVTSTADVGPGSLRQAILDNNATAGLNTIAFDIGRGGLQTIRPASALPTITNPVILDGTTQPGYAGTPPIELNGAAAGRGVNGLTISAGDTTVTGLVINGFSSNGIFFQNNGDNVVAGNYIGTDVTGTQVLANGGDGLGFLFVSNNTIGGTSPGAGNLISGNTAGIHIGGHNDVIQGNRIGTDVMGTVPLGNRRAGIVLENDGSGQVTVGGMIAAARNLISGNLGDGILEIGGRNLIEGNYIGTDPTGTSPLANAQNGIFLEDFGFDTIGGTSPGAGNLISGNAASGIAMTDSGGNVVEGNVIGTDVTGSQALGNGGAGVNVDGAFNTIGGVSPGAGNLISGNAIGVGIGLGGNVVVQGNYIGTDVTGTQALGNGTGVVISDDANGDIIGGVTPGAGNLISGNRGDGVRVQKNYNVVQGNLIGTDVTGTAPLGNGGNGVVITPDYMVEGFHNTIGGTAPGAGNIIAYNAGDGVLLAYGTGNVVSRNSIFSSGSLGIELLPGANNNQSFPASDSAVLDRGSITINGSLQSTPDTAFTLEFFGDDVCNPSGYGEGQRFLGAATVTTDDSGAAAFSVTFILPSLNPGAYVAATATDPSNDTSAFSQCVAITSPDTSVAEALNIAVPLTGQSQFDKPCETSSRILFAGKNETRRARTLARDSISASCASHVRHQAANAR